MNVLDIIRETSARETTRFSFELLPPLKGDGTRSVFTTIEALREFDPAFINVTFHRESIKETLTPDGHIEWHRMRRRPGTVGISAAIRDRFGIEVVPHLICGGLSRYDIEDALIDMDFLGLHNVLALRGDCGPNERHFMPHPQGHSHAIDLVRQIAAMNRGEFVDGEVEECHHSKFSIGVAGYPEKHVDALDAESDLRHLKAKVDAGADYVMTQICYDAYRILAFIGRCREAGIDVPVIPGVKPLSTLRQLTLLPETLRHRTARSTAQRSPDACRPPRSDPPHRRGVGRRPVPPAESRRRTGDPFLYHGPCRERAPNHQGGILTMADELDIIAFRRALHRRPELSFRETGTHDLIARTLDGLGIAHRTVARTGVLARIEGRGDLRRAVVLRADIDALPIREQADVAWRSLNDGVMHACGHDVHTAVLMGALQELNRSRDFEGTLLGLFQPGEECNPGGASLVLAEEPFADYDVRAVVGEHVEPSLEVGTFGFRAGKYMASSDELRFTVHGTGGHAALRNQLRDPVAAAAELVGGLIALNLPERVLSIGRIEADGATNVVPDDVRLEGTLRTFDEALRCASYDAIRDIAASTDRRYGTRTAVDIGRGYPCVVNDPALASLARSLAAERWQAVDLPLRTTAEDFGFYTHRYPSLFYRLGVGAASGKPHTSTFSPDEKAITTGIAFMQALALKLLNEK